MEGQHQIISMRLEGLAPDYIFLNDFPCQTTWLENNEAATVCVHEDDLRTIDLRFLAGMQVLALTTDKKRHTALYNACKRHHPKLLVVNLVQTDKPYWSQDNQILTMT